MRVSPGGHLLGFLGPVGQCGLVTPIEELAHGKPMSSVKHEGLHGLLGVPAGTRPESISLVAKQLDSEVPLSGLCLFGDANGSEYEGGQKEEGPHAQPGYRNDGHAHLSRSIGKELPAG